MTSFPLSQTDSCQPRIINPTMFIGPSSLANVGQCLQASSVKTIDITRIELLLYKHSFMNVDTMTKNQLWWHHRFLLLMYYTLNIQRIRTQEQKKGGVGVVVGGRKDWRQQS